VKEEVFGYQAAENDIIFEIELCKIHALNMKAQGSEQSFDMS